MYNEDSLFLGDGKYKFTSLKNIPYKGLLHIQNHTKDKNLKDYIKQNIDNLSKISEKGIDKYNAKTSNCNKICFVNEKEAMREILRIMLKKQTNKKPVRIYKCFCGAYHLTSKKFIE